MMCWLNPGICLFFTGSGRDENDQINLWGHEQGIERGVAHSLW